jgi:hypothetical protein
MGDAKTNGQKILLLWGKNLITDITQIDNRDFVVLDPDAFLGKEEESDERAEGEVLYLEESCVGGVLDKKSGGAGEQENRGKDGEKEDQGKGDKENHGNSGKEPDNRLTDNLEGEEHQY